MNAKTSLMRGAAVSAVMMLGTSVAAHATTHTHKKVVRHVVAHDSGEIAALRDQVQALKAQLDAQGAQAAQTQAQAAQAQQAAETAQQQIETAQAADADATAAIIQSIPVAVAAEADKLKPKTDAFYYKGLKITPGGFLEMDALYRQHNLASDVGTPFNSVPYAVTKVGHTEEMRFSARQSRVSALVEGQVNPDLKLSFYVEADFQGAAQTANLNQSDSFNLRQRAVYGTGDWADEGWHLLVGDGWSLVTTNSKGITPRNEVLPPTIDSQYNVGFVWARQPGVRLVKDLFDKHLWLAVAAEQPQTTFGGSAPAGTTVNINNGSNYYAGDTGTLATTVNAAGAVTAVSGVAPATQSINHIPDIIGKVAVEEDVFGHHVHGEVFGLYRDFYEQYANLKTNDVAAGSAGGALTVQVVPSLLDAQVSGISGNGVGRYGTSGLPDVAFLPSGKISAIQETATLFNVTLHPTKMTDIWVEGGQEHQVRPDGGKGSYGAFSAVNTGCNIEGSALACAGNTRMLSELSAGLWQKLYSGPWGYARFGVQYSYVDREAFGGVGGAPTAKENMLYTSIRYYPF